MQNEAGEDIKVSTETISFLKRHTNQLQTKIKKIESKIKSLEEKVEYQFSGMKSAGYKLHSVFIHRGQASFGHYWIYIRDFKRGIYRVYNDKTISEVPESEVTGNEIKDPEATPYFVTYIREDLVDSLVDTVVRKIEVNDDDNESNDNHIAQIKNEDEHGSEDLIELSNSNSAAPPTPASLNEETTATVYSVSPPVDEKKDPSPALISLDDDEYPPLTR